MPEGSANPCVIKVLGVGGGGGNAVNRMVSGRCSDVLLPPKAVHASYTRAWVTEKVLTAR